MVLPVLVLMLAKITVSVRVPIRPGPASPPSSRTLSRRLPAQGSCGSGRCLAGLESRPGRALVSLLTLENSCD